MVTVCGAGTLGANLLEHLARTGCRSLRVIDCDKVEERNLANQPYTSVALGRPKCEALSELLYYASGVQLEGLTRRLTADNAASLLKGSRLVVDALDNSASRGAVSAACRRLGLECLHVGLSRDGYGEVVWDEHYQVPPDEPGAPCLQPLSRTLSLLVVAAASDAIERFLESGEKRGFSVTREDLTIATLPARP